MKLFARDPKISLSPAVKEGWCTRKSFQFSHKSGKTANGFHSCEQIGKQFPGPCVCMCRKYNFRRGFSPYPHSYNESKTLCLCLPNAFECTAGGLQFCSYILFIGVWFDPYDDATLKHCNVQKHLDRSSSVWCTIPLGQIKKNRNWNETQIKI